MAYLVANTHQLLFGAFAAIPGPIQTVPRSELFAVLMVVSAVVPGAVVTIVSDSAITVKGIQEHRCTGSNADLWDVIWRFVASKRIALKARWVKSHTLN